jgi:hypothetical protein
MPRISQRSLEPELLRPLKVEQLKEICKMFNLRSYSSLKRKELITKVKPVLKKLNKIPELQQAKYDKLKEMLKLAADRKSRIVKEDQDMWDKLRKQRQTVMNAINDYAKWKTPLDITLWDKKNQHHFSKAVIVRVTKANQYELEANVLDPATNTYRSFLFCPDPDHTQRCTSLQTWSVSYR